jgi:hypothetical protein
MNVGKDTCGELTASSFLLKEKDGEKEDEEEMGFISKSCNAKLLRLLLFPLSLLPKNRAKLVMSALLRRLQFESCRKAPRCHVMSTTL